MTLGKDRHIFGSMIYRLRKKHYLSLSREMTKEDIKDLGVYKAVIKYINNTYLRRDLVTKLVIIEELDDTV